MTIAERIHNDGYIKGEQRILRLFLQNGVDPEWIQKITGLSAEQIQALGSPCLSVSLIHGSRANQRRMTNAKLPDALRLSDLHYLCNLLNLRGL